MITISTGKMKLNIPPQETCHPFRFPSPFYRKYEDKQSKV